MIHVRVREFGGRGGIDVRFEVLIEMIVVVDRDVEGRDRVRRGRAGIARNNAAPALAMNQISQFGIRAGGLRHYLATFASPSPIMIPLNFVESLTRAFSMFVRLFGNVMSGVFVIGIVLSLAGLLVPIPFMVLGILILFAIILFGVARSIGADTQGHHVLLDPLHLKDVRENIAPFARVAIAGKDNTALAVVTAPAGGAPAADVPTTGEQAFNTVCSACHSTGVNGAPKIGDHAAWGPRIAQGKETLYKDAIAGKGSMPPKGGTTWPDATIRMTVDYMVSLNK